MIEARWYDSLVMSLEDMGGPIILDTETDDIVEAYDEAVRYEVNSHGCLEIESHVLYRDGVEIPFEEIAKAFEERYGSDDEDEDIPAADSVKVYSVEAHVFGNYVVDIITDTEEGTYAAWMYKKNYNEKAFILGAPIAQQSKEEFVKYATRDLFADIGWYDEFIADHEDAYIFSEEEVNEEVARCIEGDKQ